MAVRKLSTDMSPVASVAEVMTPGPEKRTFMCAFEKGARSARGRRKYVTPRVQLGGRVCSITSSEAAPAPAMVPVMRPGW